MDEADIQLAVAHFMNLYEAVVVCAEHMMTTKKMVSCVNLFELIMQMTIYQALQWRAVEPLVAGFYFTNYENRL